MRTSIFLVFWPPLSTFRWCLYPKHNTPPPALCSKFTFCLPPGFRAFSPTLLTLLLAPLLFSLDSTARGLFEAELEADAGLTASLFAKCDSRWLLDTSCCWIDVGCLLLREPCLLSSATCAEVVFEAKDGLCRLLRLSLCCWLLWLLDRDG